jgi:hypothetical protein
MDREWKETEAVLSGHLRNIAGTLLEGATSDIVAFVEPIASEMTRALRKRDPSLMDELRGQLEALAELHRVRAVGGTWAVVGVVLDAVFSMVFRAAGLPAGGEN